MKQFIVVLAAGVCLLPGAARGQVPVNSFVNFECSQTNPVRLSPDGTRLFAVDTPDARVSVFDVSNAAHPKLIAEIPVGIEPVSVNPRNNDEAWVVNQESDSISVISVSKGIVTDTVAAKDEPSDVVFASGLAFVSISRSNQINAYDLNTHALVASITVFGGYPQALAVSSDGAKVYAAFTLSGNATTVIPYTIAPPPPPPTNPALPPAPAQGIIVNYKDPQWNPSFIQFNMPDNDVVEINAASNPPTLSRYFNAVGTINLGLAVQPKTGDLYVANTDALNAGPSHRFEENIQGHFINNRISHISIASGTVTAYDLNPGINYKVLPNPAALAIALSQPAATVFDPSGNFMWVAAFGTDRVAKVSPNGQVLQRIEIGNTPGALVDPMHKRGPRGLALNAGAQTLYVLNRISNTISVVNTSAAMVSSERPVGSYDPTPMVIRNGRGFLYDAKLSGNGTGACAACHIDGDMDHLAWDLGDPDGTITIVQDPGFSLKIPEHPMKGPMVTLSLKGLTGVAPYHWRGDKAGFLDFNAAFPHLMGCPQLSSNDMHAFQDFIDTVNFQPNPNENLDRSLPTSLAGGNPLLGEEVFRTKPFRAGLVTCNFCHFFPGTGTDKLIFPGVLLQEPQALKTPQIRNMYQKLLFNNAPGAQTIDGVGLTHDGTVAGQFAFFANPLFGEFSTDTYEQTQVAAFDLCFDTGMAPAVGYARTVTQANVNNSSVISDWATLESQAAAGNADLIIKGTIQGQVHGLLYQPTTNNYKTDATGLGPFTHTQLVNFIVQNNDTLSPMGVPYGSGYRMGIDRDNDGVLDGDGS